MSNYEWHLVGTDARQHAFASEGGYLVSVDTVSILSAENGLGPEEIFGPYEAYVSECGMTVPVAMLLTASASERCTACRVRIGSLRVATGSRQIRRRSQETTAAWDSRAASLSELFDDFAFLADVEPSAM